MSDVTIHSEDLGEARLVRLVDGRAGLWAPQPAAPGSRVRGHLPDGRALRLKVARCVRVEGGFELEARLIDATRDLRQWLQQALAEEG